jgi:membrane dipeptidase
MTDEMLRALAKNGGVVGVNFGAAFLHPEDAQEFKAVLAKLKASEGGIPNPADLDSYAAQDYKQRGLDRATTANATVKDVADHIDHIVKVAGIDHVGIGSDFDGVPTLPKGLEDASKMPALTAELLQRGYSEQDIYKIMGGNLLRVIREVEGR